MADDAPDETARPDAVPPQSAPQSGERAGDFERYALIAALTLVVLCLLVWDRWHDRGAAARTAPPPDRTLRVEIGGDAAAKPAAPPAKQDAPRVASDVPPSAPPPAAERTYTVKSGDTLTDIARRELGAASRAQELADLNGVEDPTKLRVGQVLKLPAK
jgi:nucleoid-associated protein YgaU